MKTINNVFLVYTKKKFLLIYIHNFKITLRQDLIIVWVKYIWDGYR